MQPLAITNFRTEGLGNTPPLQTLGFNERQADFARILGKAQSAAPDRPAAARQAAEDFVAMSMVQPLLAELRSSNHAAAPFAPTSGEAQFQQMLDAHTAQNIVRAKQFPLVDSVARKLLSKFSGEVSAAGPGTHSRPAHESTDPSSSLRRDDPRSHDTIRGAEHDAATSTTTRHPARTPDLTSPHQGPDLSAIGPHGRGLGADRQGYFPVTPAPRRTIGR